MKESWNSLKNKPQLLSLYIIMNVGLMLLCLYLLFNAVFKPIQIVLVFLHQSIYSPVKTYILLIIQNLAKHLAADISLFKSFDILTIINSCIAQNHNLGSSNYYIAIKKEK